MMANDAPASALEMPAQMQTTHYARMQLRILSGYHQGASLDIELGQSLRVGRDDDCDVLLADCGLAAGAAVQVVLQDGRWSLVSAADHAEDAQQGAAAPSYALGAAALLGQVFVTVCSEQAVWTVPSPEDLALEAAEPQATVEQTSLNLLDITDVLEAQGGQEPLQKTPAVAAESRKLRSSQMLVAALAIAILGAGWAVWHYAQANTPANVVGEMPAKPTLSREAQDKAVKDATLAIALVDPALRMQVALNTEGGVTVSGWVDNVEQLDRLAQALSGLRPQPRLAVRTAIEVLDAFSDVGAEQGVNLQYALLGSGRVQVKGVVLTAAMQQLVLTQLRARAPEGIEIVDSLRIAALQGPAVRQWLESHAIAVRQADWDGEQLILGVDVSAQQRSQLERLLAAAQTPLSGVPFLLETRAIKESAAGARRSAQEAGLPFRIRSVVGGSAPYVVLADGVKLQPGGGRAGWRLVTVAQDYLVFDGPKRVEISR